MTWYPRAARQSSVILVGIVPPPVNGQSVAFALLVEFLGRSGRPYVALDMPVASRSQTRILFAARVFRFAARYIWSVVLRPRVIYLTIGQSRSGFIRDALLTWLAVAFRVRVVYHLHGGNYRALYDCQSWVLRCVMRATLRRVDSLILLSDHLRSDFDFEPALGSKIRIVPNGVPGPIDPSGKRLPTGAEPIRIVYLSTLYSSKGYLDLLRAVAILRRRNKLNIHCAFCGALYEGAERRPSTFAGSGFANSISRMGLESAVTYEGLVLGEEKAEMLRRSHIFVLPTAYPNEGQPISAIEALSYGIPVVATPYRGLKDIVVDGLTGLFVPFGDPCSLAKSLSRLVSDARLYERMSEGALARYQEQFTLSQHLKGVMAAFE